MRLIHFAYYILAFTLLASCQEDVADPPSNVDIAKLGRVMGYRYDIGLWNFCDSIPSYVDIKEISATTFSVRSNDNPSVTPYFPEIIFDRSTYDSINHTYKGIYEDPYRYFEYLLYFNPVSGQVTLKSTVTPQGSEDIYFKSNKQAENYKYVLIEDLRPYEGEYRVIEYKLNGAIVTDSSQMAITQMEVVPYVDRLGSPKEVELLMMNFDNGYEAALTPVLLTFSEDGKAITSLCPTSVNNQMYLKDENFITINYSNADGYNFDLKLIKR